MSGRSQTRSLEVGSALVAVAAGLYGLWLTLPTAIDLNYGQLPTIAVPITAWAVWIGSRHHQAGPMRWPEGPALPAALAAAGLLLAALGAGWLASLLIAPAMITLVRAFLPRLATPRLLLLLFIAPTSYVLDTSAGETLRVVNAAISGWLASLYDPTLGARLADELSCGVHTIVVTPACSGARLAVRMLALASVLCVLKPLPARATAGVLVAALGFSAASNIGRISALCVAAPGYETHELPGLELYHDISGLASFAVAYLVLGFLIARLAKRGGASPS